MKTPITEKDKTKANELIELISPVEGEKRVVYKCLDCGGLFVRRFIPFGIGKGLTVNPCLCQLTAQRNSISVMESTP